MARRVETAIVAHARAEAPRECCGLLIGAADEIVDTVAASNIASNPTTRYLIDPQDHLRAIREARGRGLQVIGAYHSHPRSAATPSPTDAAEGFGHFVFVIAGLATEPPELTAWGWTDGNFAAMPLVRLP
jgi:proteasome lid subunit RPN8/RPN11